MRKILFVDTETTGLNPEHHEIRQIAGKYIEFPDENGLLTGLTNPKVSKSFNWFIKPNHMDRISPEVREKFGVNEKMFEDAKYKSQADVFQRFYASVKDKVDPFDPQDKIFMAGHNVAEFDYRFIRNWWTNCCKELGMEKAYFGSYFHWSCLDTKLLMAFCILDGGGSMKVPKKNHLTGLCEHLKIDLSEKDAHDAFADISATEKVMFKLLENIDTNYTTE